MVLRKAPNHTENSNSRDYILDEHSRDTHGLWRRLKALLINECVIFSSIQLDQMANPFV